MNNTQDNLMCKRVLVVSNNCFSKGNSNGRTLMNLMSLFDKANIAQFYISGMPDFDFCNKYYKVSDRDALDAFKSLRRFSKDGYVIYDPEKSSKNQVAHPRIRPRNCRNFFFRNIVWGSMRWWNRHFDEFINSFEPQAVLLQAGDAPFMYKISVKIAKKYNIPLIMFNTENYVLKKVLYSDASKKDPFHALLKGRLKKRYEKAMDAVAHCVYSTENLENEYQTAYPHSGKSSVLYVSSDIEICRDGVSEAENFTLSYFGNLGVGRADALCDMADALGRVSGSAVLQVYGKFIKEEDKNKLCGKPNVVYNGVVPYSEIPKIIAESSMVIHCENNSRLQDLINAFSTKIADCLSCEKPFLVYATKKYPFCAYLDKNSAAHIAENEDELYELLKKCYEDAEFRNKYVENAKTLAQKNHNFSVNAEKMYKIINDKV